MHNDHTLDEALAPIRAESWRGTPPPMGSLRDSRRRGTHHRLLFALALGAGAGLAYGGYHVLSRSWTASVTVTGQDVEVVFNGQVIPPENVEWLPDGTCLVTVNGARILLDPTQEGGATATIRVEQPEED